MIPKIFADISIPEPVLGITSIIALLFGCLFILLACSCIGRRKPGRSGLYGLFSLLFFGIAAFSLSGALNIHTYQSLSYLTNVAEIHFDRLGSQRFAVEININEPKSRQQFDLLTDE